MVFNKNTIFGKLFCNLIRDSLWRAHASNHIIIKGFSYKLYPSQKDFLQKYFHYLKQIAKILYFKKYLQKYGGCICNSYQPYMQPQIQF